MDIRSKSGQIMFTQAELDAFSEQDYKERKKIAAMYREDYPRNGDLVSLYDPDAGGGMTEEEVNRFTDKLLKRNTYSNL